MYDLRFKTNAKLLLSGPSGSGKTFFVYNLIKNHNILFKQKFTKIIFLYHIYQEIYDKIKKECQIPIDFIQNSEIDFENFMLNSNVDNNLIIIDDQILVSDINIFTKLFTIWTRHKNISTIFITQKLFINNENYRIISDNADYIILFSNPRNLTSISILGSQILPGDTKIFKTIYHEATGEPFSHLLCDFTQDQLSAFRFRSNYFKEDGIIKVYILNKFYNSVTKKK